VNIIALIVFCWLWLLTHNELYRESFLPRSNMLFYRCNNVCLSQWKVYLLILWGKTSGEMAVMESIRQSDLDSRSDVCWHYHAINRRLIAFCDATSAKGCWWAWGRRMWRIVRYIIWHCSRSFFCGTFRSSGTVFSLSVSLFPSHTYIRRQSHRVDAGERIY
jgi:hypothetical protein